MIKQYAPPPLNDAPPLLYRRGDFRVVWTHLPRVRSCNPMNERIIIHTNAKKSLCAHGRTDLCKQREVDGIIECERRYGCRGCSSVHNSEVLLLQQRKRLNTMPLEHSPAGHDLARTIEHPDIADASNGPSNVCQWGEILIADQAT